MDERVRFRLLHIDDAIGKIRRLLDDKTFDVMFTDAVIRAAYERFLEIISEASRHIPDGLKADLAPEIPWRRIADLGNHIRHGYNKLDVEILWGVYENDLGALEEAVERMLDR
ncbi:HepT-like ribonuclease domain-containing protein [Methylopila sp. M107]|uniref:HepT-like ribonuclease domain-containing protein n=1 Tax=Methylopila sp. M107 TaxID=1101190 RepID=UPI00035CF406|nr:HepT-like ribonuclease domain-containing protein [Methylopila sp. M107]